jgi:hypothetical protein
MPVLNILIWHLNAALLYIFGDNWNAHIWMNLLLSVLILIFFFRSQKESRSITLGILSIFFLLPLFLYLFEDYFSEDAPYFLQSLVGGLIAGGILITAEYFKK